MDQKLGHTPGSRGSAGEGSGEAHGPYTLLAEIARGTLCSVHLARKHGALGFARLVALKRLSDQFASDPECQQLLADEVRLTSALHHANVGSVLDVGTERGRTFVVMDYIEGASLETLLSRAGRDRHPRFVVPIVVDLLHGLHALHSATDENGALLGIVHQAPIGRHVLVGTDGTARVVDFSQARSLITKPTRQRSERLRVHSMAPEQALEPDRADPRTDLFIVGILLWEALTGERLFAASSEHQTFLNMLHRRIPRPSEVGCAPPSCFDPIVQRALSRDPEKRYASAFEMARDLRDVALNQALYANAGEVGQWVRVLAGPELQERRKRAGSDIFAEDPFELGAAARSMSLPPASPYGTGRIIGGNFEPEESAALKAPDFYVHAPRPAEPPSHEEAEPTIRAPMPDRVQRLVAEEAAMASLTPSSEYTTPFSSAEHGSYPPSARSRVPTKPFPSAELTPPAPRASIPTRPYVMPFAEREETSETTSPDGFVPARAGGRREPSAPSPGAYSELRDRPRRSSSPAAPESTPPRVTTPPGPPGFSGRGTPGPSEPERVRVPDRIASRMESERAAAERRSRSLESDGNPFGERGTGRLDGFDLGGSRPTPTPPVGRPTPTPSVGRPSPTPARGRPAQEPPAQKVQRNDSTPSRFSIPSSPVGLPYGVAPPNKAHHYELPTSPHGIDLLHARSRELDAMKALADTLTPPTTAARTEPPAQIPPQPRPRSLWFWAGTGTLAGIIALAGFVGLRNWGALSLVDGAPRSLAASPMLDQAEVEPASAPVPQVKPGAQLGEAAPIEPDLRTRRAHNDAQPVRARPAPAADAGADPEGRAGEATDERELSAARTTSKAHRHAKRDGAQAAAESAATDAPLPAPEAQAEAQSGASVSPLESGHLRGASLPENPY